MLATGLSAAPSVANAASAEVQAQTPAPPSSPGAAQPQTLIGVHQLPPNAPPPGGGPPSGSQGPPGPTLPPAGYESVGPFTMYMEVLAGAAPSQYGLIASPGCVTDGVYKRGMKMVFRFEIYDMQNATRVTPADGSTATVSIVNGPVLPGRFTPRGDPSMAQDPDAAWTWVSTWDIPPDYPLGLMAYNVSATTADGRSATITPLTPVLSYPAIVP